MLLKKTTPTIVIHFHQVGSSLFGAWLAHSCKGLHDFDDPVPPGLLLRNVTLLPASWHFRQGLGRRALKPATFRGRVLLVNELPQSAIEESDFVCAALRFIVIRLRNVCYGRWRCCSGWKMWH